MEERRRRQPEEKQELSELWELFHSQERELHEMRIRLSRFMTKGAPVFVQQPVAQTKASSHKANFQPHVHFSRSLTTGSSGEQNNTELVADALDEGESKVHKGRTLLYKQSQRQLNLNSIDQAKSIMDKVPSEKGFEEIRKHEGASAVLNDTKDIPQNAIPTKKKHIKKQSIKPYGTVRPKSARPNSHEKGSKAIKITTSNNLNTEDAENQNELQMETEDKKKSTEGALNVGKDPSVEKSPSTGYGSNPNTDLKHSSSNDTDMGAGADNTSRDLTSLSLTTASPNEAKQKQTNPKISISNVAQ